MHAGKTPHEDLKKRCTPLDIGSHINAGRQARLKAEAQRTL
jgi:hypothetical protein